MLWVWGVGLMRIRVFGVSDFRRIHSQTLNSKPVLKPHLAFAVVSRKRGRASRET